MGKNASNEDGHASYAPNAPNLEGLGAAEWQYSVQMGCVCIECIECHGLEFGCGGAGCDGSIVTGSVIDNGFNSGKNQKRGGIVDIPPGSWLDAPPVGIVSLTANIDYSCGSNVPTGAS
jgi:hypothetical protein